MVASTEITPRADGDWSPGLAATTRISPQIGVVGPVRPSLRIISGYGAHIAGWS
jgi:hypothetical protein